MIKGGAKLEAKEISQAVVSRLPRYFRYLGELKDEGVERISSQELSKLMRVTASQIRQDFNNFGGFGQQGCSSGRKNTALIFSKSFAIFFSIILQIPPHICYMPPQGPPRR